MKMAIISMIRDSWGGSEELWHDMAKIALADGHRVMHLSYSVKEKHPKLNELTSLGLRSYTRPGLRNWNGGSLGDMVRLGWVYVKKRMSRSLEQMLRSSPDVIIYNGTCYSIAHETHLLRYLRKTNTPFFIIAHFNSEAGRPLSENQAALVNEAYGRAKKVFFFSERTRVVAQRHLCNNIPNAKLLRNPVNMRELEAIDYPDHSETIQFACVANLVTAHKGQDLLLSVLADPVWQSRNFHLNIYGSGPDETYLRSLAGFYNLNTKLSFHGRVDDIRGVWRENHMLLLPSHMEGMPLALVEAMLCGRPVVVTDVGGNAEWVEDEISGFVAEAATLPCFSKAMERAWHLRDRWNEMGLNAHKRAIGLFDPNAGSTLFEEIKQ